MSTTSKFKLKYNRLRISNHHGECIVLDTTFKNNTFRYSGKPVSYTAMDGGDPSNAHFSKAGRKWNELLLGFEELTWGWFLDEVQHLDGELTYLIIGTTMQIVFKEKDGDTISCRFMVSY